MSKSTTDPWDFSDRIPSYEESIAASHGRPNPTSWERTASTTSMIRQERTRRIFDLVTNSIIPCFTTHLANACHHLTIVILPADALRTPQTVTERNIVSPSLHSHETTGSLIHLSGVENRSSFWTQNVVVQELDQILRRELSGSAPAEDIQPESLDSKSPVQPPSQFQVQPLDDPLPPRPSKKSWLKRTFVLPDADHDPTGETGKWDLGWRSPGPFEAGEASTSRPRVRTRTLRADEVAVHARMQDVSFRTESEMGLLETATVKCIWIEIEVGI